MPDFYTIELRDKVLQMLRQDGLDDIKPPNCNFIPFL